MEAVFRPENFWIFSGAFRSLSCAFPPETGRKLPEKIRNFPAGILLPCSDDFRCIPAGSSVFSVSFLQLPSGSGHRNLRPRLSSPSHECTYTYVQGWPERGLLGLRQAPIILETSPALFNHIRKNEFPFTTILIGNCRDRHESSISEVFASFRGNLKKFSVSPLAKMMLYVL